MYNESSAYQARDALAALYPALVIDPSSRAYTESQHSFWSACQRQNTPVCFFQPENSEQVQRAMVEVVRAKCPFVIKGGGHSANPLGSSIRGGVQFDLVKLNHVEIAADKQTVRVGPGVRWGDLFLVLEKAGVIAVGGRDYGVGVPGFVFGGGISYYSNLHGWGIDNLVSVDIVLATGETVTVNSSDHLDLFKAIRGGGAHNFGIVTSLTLKLYPFQGMWGGMNVVSEEHFDAVFAAYDVYTKDLFRNGKAHIIMDFFRQDGEMVVAQFMGYPEPLSDPPIFENLRRIPSALNTLRLADNSDLASEMAQVTDSTGKRNSYWTLAMEYDINLLRSAFELWARKTKPLANRFRFAFDVNHITPAMRNKAAREGRHNVYGLEGPDEPLTNILLTAVWEQERDDAQVQCILRDLGEALEALAQSRGKHRLFKYMNYANHEQDVISGFGSKSKAFLLAVSAKYDPESVFQKLQTGGFKLDASGRPFGSPHQEKL
ncbi:hypothetical protein BDV33DRAFT_176750 [Aspergillus novoparasiticus]|uniref:FAD-binding PCMH-type domain-containing protein n=1 Tax=Aspergillus novoparasiticus TaxID=986946 RepID=A0A5N6ELT5_9EURO|nr:hypothetical protein BDV33DRAFT_176750 [Aspergillus novoparasiticus]